MMGLIKDYKTACLYFVAFDSPNLLWWDELIWTISALPYPGRLGKLPNALYCLLQVATQQVCKFSSAGCQRVGKIFEG